MSDFARLEPHVVDEIVRICEVMLREFEDAQTTAAKLPDLMGATDPHDCGKVRCRWRPVG